ncbi:hypothetical protein M514_00615 [Trichuris suis]|uniref:Uncharacterized protein n=1 Tax=Trichuris suis TaxID=68888 RepID=A0A085MQN2_9BILA|nr:hypothetical protein M514_00615 [Trichuris suis]
MVSLFVDNTHGVIVRFLLLFFEGFGSLLEPSSGKFFEKAECWSDVRMLSVCCCLGVTTEVIKFQKYVKTSFLFGIKGLSVLASY